MDNADSQLQYPYDSEELKEPGKPAGTETTDESTTIPPMTLEEAIAKVEALQLELRKVDQENVKLQVERQELRGKLGLTTACGRGEGGAGVGGHADAGNLDGDAWYPAETHASTGVEVGGVPWEGEWGAGCAGGGDGAWRQEGSGDVSWAKGVDGIDASWGGGWGGEDSALWLGEGGASASWKGDSDNACSGGGEAGAAWGNSNNASPGGGEAEAAWDDSDKWGNSGNAFSGEGEAEGWGGNSDNASPGGGEAEAAWDDSDNAFAGEEAAAWDDNAFPEEGEASWGGDGDNVWRGDDGGGEAGWGDDEGGGADAGEAPTVEGGNAGGHTCGTSTGPTDAALPTKEGKHSFLSRFSDWPKQRMRIESDSSQAWPSGDGEAAGDLNAAEEEGGDKYDMEEDQDHGAEGGPKAKAKAKAKGKAKAAAKSKAAPNPKATPSPKGKAAAKPKAKAKSQLSPKQAEKRGEAKDTWMTAKNEFQKRTLEVCPDLSKAEVEERWKDSAERAEAIEKIGPAEAKRRRYI